MYHLSQSLSSEASPKSGQSFENIQQVKGQLQSPFLKYAILAIKPQKAISYNFCSLLVSLAYFMEALSEVARNYSRQTKSSGDFLYFIECFYSISTLFCTVKPLHENWTLIVVHTAD